MLKNWIARLFGAAPAEGHVRAAPEPKAPDNTPAPGPGAGDPPLGPGNIDALFYRWVTGTGQRDTPPGADKPILDELARLVASPSSGAELMPRVPAVIPQLLRSLRDDSVTSADLARQLSQDAVLVAEVIREVNSPWYRPTVPVRNLEGAVMLLGQNGLRMLLARVAFRPIISMQAGYFARMVAPHIWAESEKCALASSLLATRMRVDPFEAYLAGMMQNVGPIVAFRVIDLVCTDQQLPHSDEFCAQLFRDAHTLSSRIAALWDFPAPVADAIGQLGEPNSPPLAQALAFGDQVAKLRMLVDAGQLDPGIPGRMFPAAQDVFDKIKSEED
ncbi:HDOD domain-containing protein [Massilia cavernae]|uniref:HDOD domain-containing protein n=1 Tax=Massilia cavernae TaxID=2320864 RepID=A0A418Y4J2_9BURK|nr:HDOD domain-containing protein [Massilia cavernae]RJG20524.1 HDOD domain-containing protein [Massilia cavernae]